MMIKTRASLLAQACKMNDVEFFAACEKIRKPTKAMDDGTILHSLILENKMPDHIEVLDFDDFRKKEAQEAKKQVIERGNIAVLRKELTHLLEYDLSEVKKAFIGQSEVAGKMIYKNSVEITGHADHIITQGNGHIIDLKCTNAKTFKNCAKEVYFSAYDVQIFLYMLMFRARTASIRFFNFETGCFQDVEIHVENIKDSCIDRLENVALPRLARYEEYRQGKKELDAVPYYPQEFIR